MKRLLKLLVVVFIVGGCLVFAGALAGGLMDDSAFTTAAREQGH